MTTDMECKQRTVTANQERVWKGKAFHFLLPNLSGIFKSKVTPNDLTQ